MRPYTRQLPHHIAEQAISSNPLSEFATSCYNCPSRTVNISACYKAYVEYADAHRDTLHFTTRYVDYNVYKRYYIIMIDHYTFGNVTRYTTPVRSYFAFKNIIIAMQQHTHDTKLLNDSDEIVMSIQNLSYYLVRNLHVDERFGLEFSNVADCVCNFCDLNKICTACSNMNNFETHKCRCEPCLKNKVFVNMYKRMYNTNII